MNTTGWKRVLRTNEAVAIWPDWVLGIKAQESLPQTINHWASAWACRVAGIGLLDRVHA